MLCVGSITNRFFIFDTQKQFFSFVQAFKKSAPRTTISYVKTPGYPPLSAAKNIKTIPILPKVYPFCSTSHPFCSNGDTPGERWKLPREQRNPHEDLWRWDEKLGRTRHAVQQLRVCLVVSFGRAYLDSSSDTPFSTAGDFSKDVPQHSCAYSALCSVHPIFADHCVGFSGPRAPI